MSADDPTLTYEPWPEIIVFKARGQPVNPPAVCTWDSPNNRWRQIVNGWWVMPHEINEWVHYWPYAQGKGRSE